MIWLDEHLDRSWTLKIMLSNKSKKSANLGCSWWSFFWALFQVHSCRGFETLINCGVHLVLVHNLPSTLPGISYHLHSSYQWHLETVAEWNSYLWSFVQTEKLDFKLASVGSTWWHLELLQLLLRWLKTNLDVQLFSSTEMVFC